MHSEADTLTQGYWTPTWS